LNGNLGEGRWRGCPWTGSMYSAALSPAAEDVGDDTNNDYDDSDIILMIFMALQNENFVIHVICESCEFQKVS
jgi:hypothetical protein